MATRSSDQILPGCRYKSGDLVITGTAPQTDANLQFHADAAGEVWLIRIIAWVTIADTNNDIRYRFSNVSSAGVLQAIGYSTTAIVAMGRNQDPSVFGLVDYSGTTTETLLTVEGIVTSAAAGVVAVEWSIATDAGADSTVHEESSMLALRIIT